MPNVQILKKKSYLAMIRNAVKGDTHLFRNLYATVDGVERDILRNGEVSCAVFVTALLYLQNPALEHEGKPRWIQFAHTTVKSAEKDLETCGWVTIPELREGAVIIWDAVKYEDGEEHFHIGFAVGNGRAVSNESNGSGIPKEHDATYDGTRRVVRIWWHPSLDEI